MKRKNIEKITSFALSGTMIFESCASGYYMEYPADDINAALISYEGDVEYNHAAIPLNLEFNSSDIEYLFFLQKLATDIIDSPEIAKDFITNPSKYITDNGFSSENISLDSKLTKIILALADEDICNAAKEGDIKEYLSLLKARNLIDTISISDIDNTINSAESINRLMRATEWDTIESQETFSFIFFGLAVIVGAAAVVWAVAVEHFIAANAINCLTAVHWYAAVVTNTLANAKGSGGGEKGENKKLANLSIDLLCTNTINIWNIKSQENRKIPILADSFLEQTISSYMEYIKQNHPNEYSKYDEQLLRNVILLNIQNGSYEYE